ncbi:MAG: peptidoglycan-binding protein [Boseongicola sp. SB0675_bin_26]|nr:peptidoglycan-binding protein [Boseongicola sp. SB0675_bin_26]
MMPGRSGTRAARRPKRKPMPFRQARVAVTIAALAISLATSASADLHNTREVKALQQVLRRCGFDPGPIDGQWGAMTARATAAYIRAHGGDAEAPSYGNRNNPVVRRQLITQAGSYMDKAQPCPAPGGEVWECVTVFGTSRTMLKADHEAGTGVVRMGTLPPIETFFEVRGPARLWIWLDAGIARSAADALASMSGETAPEHHAFQIGPRGGPGLQGHYFHFPSGTKADEIVESQATYVCEQTSG